MLTHSTNAQPANAVPYGQFVQAAYDVFSALPAVLSPTQGQYPNFPAGYTLVANLQMNDFFADNSTPRYYGFIAVNNSVPGSYIAAIRGTADMTEWWDDFQWDLVPYPWLKNAGNVATGFLTIYNTLQLTAPGTAASPALVATAGPLPPALLQPSAVKSLVLVGHSLGSALATLYAADLAGRANVNPLVYTFASPQVGDTGFTTAYNSTVSINYRIYNWPDIVPDFPKDPMDNYEHVKGGYEVDSLDDPLTVKMSIGCFHSLSTYLYLLGAPVSVLGSCHGAGIL